ITPHSIARPPITPRQGPSRDLTAAAEAAILTKRMSEALTAGASPLPVLTGRGRVRGPLRGLVSHRLRRESPSPLPSPREERGEAGLRPARLDAAGQQRGSRVFSQGWRG